MSEPPGVRRTPPKPGTLVGGRYELESVAGRGGMATVWRARVRGAYGFNRTVAVKHMHSHLAEDKLYIEMFCEEARIGSNLQDPHICQVHDFLVQDGELYLIMEWIDGVDLGTFIGHSHGGGTLHWEVAVAIGVGLLRALAAAHERRSDDGQLNPIIHRDVSPHNVLISRRGHVKLIDFGLSLARDRNTQLTEPGVVKGKMSYLSPEVVAGDRPTPASDQFAASAVLWETLVGRKLFDAPTDYEIYLRVREARVEPLRSRRPDVPGPLAHVVHRALALEQDERYPSTREMARRLGAVLEHGNRRRDLHAALSRTVCEIMDGIAPGYIPESTSSLTPVADVEDQPVPEQKPKRRGGLWHRLRSLPRRG